MTDAPAINTHGFAIGDKVRPARRNQANVPLFEVTGEFSDTMLELRSPIGTRRWFNYADVVKVQQENT